MSVVRRGNVESFAVAEIDKVAVFGGKRCIWRRGQEAPVLRIDPNSMNAAVLALLLDDWIRHQREQSGSQAEAGPGASRIGRLLFERRSIGTFAHSMVAGIHLVAIAATLRFGHHLAVVFGLTFALFEALFLRFRLGFYESGLVRRWLRREIRLKYDEITEFTYAATPRYHFGSYVGTQLSLTFRAATATIRYSRLVKNSDADLEWLRDHLAGIIATRMIVDIRAGRAVPWTSDMVLLPEGLQFRRPKKLGRTAGQVEILPYAQIRNANIDRGVFALYDGNAEAKPLISTPVGAVNFYPGFFAIMAMRTLALRTSPTRPARPRSSSPATRGG
jgi:hypothetical protein